MNVERTITLPSELDELLGHEPNPSGLVAHLLYRHFDGVLSWRSQDDVAERWLRESLQVTGKREDTFTRDDMMANFSSWLIFAGESTPDATKLEIAAALTTLVVRAGCPPADAHGTFQGGRLV